MFGKSSTFSRPRLELHGVVDIFSLAYDLRTLESDLMRVLPTRQNITNSFFTIALAHFNEPAVIWEGNCRRSENT